MKLQCDFTASGLPILNQEDIELLAEDILREKQPDRLNEPSALDVEALLMELNLVKKDAILSRNESILGVISFKKQTLPTFEEDLSYASIPVELGNIVIDSRLKKIPTRYRFTVVHELAHWMLHRTYYENPQKRDYFFRHIGFSYVACKKDPKEYGRKNPKEAETDDEWVEWQADNLSGALLMPRSQFLKVANAIMKELGYTEPKIIAGQCDPRKAIVLERLATFFQVSMRSVKIRLRTLGIYVEPESIGNSI